MVALSPHCKEMKNSSIISTMVGLALSNLKARGRTHHYYSIHDIAQKSPWIACGNTLRMAVNEFSGQNSQFPCGLQTPPRCVCKVASSAPGCSYRLGYLQHPSQEISGSIGSQQRSWDSSCCQLLVLLHLCTALIAWQRPISFHQPSLQTTVQSGRSMCPASLAHFQFEPLGVTMQVSVHAGIASGKSVLVSLEEPEPKSVMKPWVHPVQVTVSPQDLWQ